MTNTVHNDLCTYMLTIYCNLYFYIVEYEKYSCTFSKLSGDQLSFPGDISMMCCVTLASLILTNTPKPVEHRKSMYYRKWSSILAQPVSVHVHISYSVDST